MAAAVVPRQPWCLTPGATAYYNQPILWVTVVCDSAGSGAPWRPLSAIYVTTCRQMLWVVVTCVLRGKLASKHAPSDHAASIQAVISAASTPNWSILHVRRFETSWRHDACWRCRRIRRKRSWRRGFLLDAISCIDRSWWTPWSYGHHEDPLPAQKNKTISRHARQQVSIVKTRKKYHY